MAACPAAGLFSATTPAILVCGRRLLGSLVLQLHLLLLLLLLLLHGFWRVQYPLLRIFLSCVFDSPGGVAEGSGASTCSLGARSSSAAGPAWCPTVGHCHSCVGEIGGCRS